MLKFATRAVCEHPHGPWGVLTTAGPSQRNDPPQEQIPGPRRRRDTPARGHTGMAVTFFLKRVQKPALKICSGFAQGQVPLGY